jgi:hypothetical protein
LLPHGDHCCSIQRYCPHRAAEDRFAPQGFKTSILTISGACEFFHKVCGAANSPAVDGRAARYSAVGARPIAQTHGETELMTHMGWVSARACGNCRATSLF